MSTELEATKTVTTTIKKNDVFHAWYTEKYRNGKGKGWDLRHCFEGLLVAKNVTDTDSETKIFLFDTFWGIGRTDNKYFRLEDVGDIIDIRFYCNLDEVEKSPKGSSTELYYDENDYFILTRQHGCSESCKEYFIRKGAKYSQEKILTSIDRKIEQEESKIRSANWTVHSLERDREKVLSGDLNIYI